MATLTPAYGRDYKSKKAVLEDWNANKDFMYNTFNEPVKPINKSDVEAAGLTNLQFRYNKLAKTFILSKP